MNQLEITLNGQPHTLPADTTVRDLIAEHTGKQISDEGRATDGTGLGVAVAVDGTVVPRSAWGDRLLQAQSRVELVTAAQGG